MNEVTDLALKHINEASKNDSLIVFVGAGVSANSGLPLWSSLIRTLKNEISVNEEENDYLKVAQYYFDAVGQHKYIQKVCEIFQPHMNATPNSIHSELVRIKPRHLITTNYDELLENSMNSGISKYNIIVEDSDIPYSKSSNYLIKMHGDFKKRNFVLKENDYLNYEENFYMISTLIKSLIMNNTVLFIGYSLNDSTFNSIFRMIQKGFGGNAPKAYFFSPEDQIGAAVEYYKNKGIQVITDRESNSIPHLGEKTVNFLKKIKGDSLTIVPSTAEELWNNIRFLDNLYFVEIQDIISASNLNKGKAWLFPKDNYDWKGENNATFIITDEDKELTTFLNTKACLDTFLGYKCVSSSESSQNPVLLEGYSLYLENKYKEAKLKFREIANTSFQKKDYWNYLLAEFNVSHTHVFFRDDLELPESSSGSEDLKNVIESLIINGDEQTKQICNYFRDEILNFRYIHKKLFAINELLSQLRQERYNYKKGGSSSNDHLWNLQYEFQSFMSFVKSNCITVFQYKEFKAIVNQYFECLLIAFDNSNYEPTEDSGFLGGRTSSIIEELSLEDIENIIPHLDKKSMSTLVDNYSLSKIKISDEALDYIFEKIDELSKVLQKSYDNDNQLDISKYLHFLSFVEIKDVSRLFPILENYPISNSSEEIRKLLRIIINERDLLKGDYNKLFSIINRHLNIILTEINLTNSNANNFNLYSYLLKLIAEQNIECKLFNEKLEDILCLINSKEEKLSEIASYEDYLVNFYSFLDDELKKLIDSIMKNYDQRIETDFNMYFIIAMISKDIYLFESKKSNILKFLANTIDMEEKPGMKTFPDPKKRAIYALARLIQKGYYSFEEVEKVIDLNSIKGISPEIDWFIFGNREEETVGKLVKNSTFKIARDRFAKAEDEKNVFDKWLSNQILTDKLDISDKRF